MLALPTALAVKSAVRAMRPMRPISALAALGAVEPAPPAATPTPAAPATTVAVVPVEPIAAIPTVTLPRATSRRVGATLGGRTRGIGGSFVRRGGLRGFGDGGFAARYRRR